MKIVAFALLLAACSNHELDACDEAIKHTLKAPSTYKRISSAGDTADGFGIITVKYDAANSYGVPLRSQGTCFVQDGRVRWSEDR